MREAMKSKGNVLRNAVAVKEFESSHLKASNGHRGVFSASYASPSPDPSSTGSSPTGMGAGMGINPRSASSGGMLESTAPFTQMQLLRNDADSPYLYAPSPDDASATGPVDQPYSFGQRESANAFVAH